MPKQPPSGDPLDKLVVFDRLEVGPAKLESRRLVAPYRLTVGGETDRFDLIYTYEEAVFSPDEAESVNLAGMIAAQVALNYGLFCREIVFHGPFDDLDRRFLRNMAENTAREIFVKKFLEPNPFLTGIDVPTVPVKPYKFLNARFRFVSPVKSGREAGWKLWATDKTRHCILSSGGKDSLLSYGLMNDITHPKSGRPIGEVHPIFVNESGRHWFTALNAYRHFTAHVPHTGRVWVNSDRLFAWMLTRMPFIRKNFADIRSDEYPIRLWTVAVFLFGVLPLMRKRGIGRLLIGDEYDTTVTASHQGIRHYDGLYDQSIHFDQALSGYFMQKGWAISQFSILRPLSEMLIEKILVERYPHLQHLQMSCHATHKEADGIRPCGRCEKCRRIVGMLKALDADPTRCGYTAEQIDACLRSLAERGVHQEAEGASRLLYLLSEKKLVDLPGGPVPKMHPEVMRLRFDSVGSPANALPVDLRRPLYDLYLQHTDAALRRKGRKWEPFDLLRASDLAVPYPFELDPVDNGGRLGKSTVESTAGFAWGELTWPEAEKRLKRVDIAILPVGAIEQHGPHLPLDTDAFDAEYLANRVAEACSDPKPLVLPLVPYGVSYHHEDFRGTISIRNDTLSQLVYDIGMSAARNGIRKLIIINGHGGNLPALNHAAQMVNRDAHVFVCVDTGETSDVDIDDIVETQNDVHAGEIETSTSLAVRPNLVRMDLAKAFVPDFSSRYLNFTSRRGVSWYAYTRKISATGVMGDPTRASAEKGEKIWQTMIAHLVALAEDLKSMSLEEIYHRRY